MSLGKVDVNERFSLSPRPTMSARSFMSPNPVNPDFPICPPPPNGRALLQPVDYDNFQIEAEENWSDEKGGFFLIPPPINGNSAENSLSLIPKRDHLPAARLRPRPSFQRPTSCSNELTVSLSFDLSHLAIPSLGPILVEDPTQAAIAATGKLGNRIPVPRVSRRKPSRRSFVSKAA